MARPKGSKNKAVKADMSLLSQEEQDAIRLKAKEQVTAEAKKEAEDQLLAQAVEEERRGKGLEEEIVEVTVDLAPYTDRILLDNRAFLQGVTYSVPLGVACVMREAMQKTWNHQAEIDGKSENFYRRTRGQRVVPAGNGAAVVNTSQLLRA